MTGARYNYSTNSESNFKINWIQTDVFQSGLLRSNNVLILFHGSLNLSVSGNLLHNLVLNN
jgi:hypothetical protein